MRAIIGAGGRSALFPHMLSYPTSMNSDTLLQQSQCTISAHALLHEYNNSPFWAIFSRSALFPHMLSYKLSKQLRSGGTSRSALFPHMLSYKSNRISVVVPVVSQCTISAHALLLVMQDGEKFGVRSRSALFPHMLSYKLGVVISIWEKSRSALFPHMLSYFNFSLDLQHMPRRSALFPHMLSYPSFLQQTDNEIIKINFNILTLIKRHYFCQSQFNLVIFSLFPNT